MKMVSACTGIGMVDWGSLGGGLAAGPAWHLPFVPLGLLGLVLAKKEHRAPESGGTSPGCYWLAALLLLGNLGWEAKRR